MRRLVWRILVPVAILAALGVAVAIILPGRMHTARVEGVVRDYTTALTLALGELDPDAIDGVATPEQKSKVAAYITYLWGTDVFMEAQLLDLEIVELERQGDSTFATVQEEWRYQLRDRRTRETVGGGTRTEQTVRYELTSEGGGLLVADVEVLEER